MVTAACADVLEKSLRGRGIDLPQLSFKLFVYTFISNKISLLFHPLSLCLLTWPLDHVNYCHYFSSVVCLSTFQIFGGMVLG